MKQFRVAAPRVFVRYRREAKFTQESSTEDDGISCSLDERDRSCFSRTSLTKVGQAGQR